VPFAQTVIAMVCLISIGEEKSLACKKEVRVLISHLLLLQSVILMTSEAHEDVTKSTFKGGCSASASANSTLDRGKSWNHE
jgi:hypothetical protein